MNKLIAKYIIFLPGQALRGEYILKYIREFEKTEWQDIRALEQLQWSKLSRLITHAAKYSPYYRELFIKNNLNPATIRDKNDFLKVPQLTKEDLRYNQMEMISTAYHGRFSKKTTGGSTGEAVTVLKDRKAMAYQDAAMWRSLRWSGIDIGDKQARFWGISINPYVKAKYRFVDFCMNRIRISAFNFNDQSMGSFYKRLQYFRPKYFYGYVSMIKEFAEYCCKKNINAMNLNLKKIVTTSEPLFEETREFLQDVFGCKVINDYGCGEVGPVAYDCPEGGLHLMSDNLYIEVINENGTYASPGEKGEIIVTELNNYSLPLIRYNLKDIAEVAEGRCRCGRGLPIIKSVTGRVLDVLVTGNGEKVHGEYFNYIAEEVKSRGLGLKQYQVIQKTTDNLIVKIVKDKAYSQETQTYIQDRIRDRMGENVQIHFEFVDKVEREKSGKLRLVKSEIHH